MVKLNKYAFVGAMLLTGAVGFTACSSDDLAEGPNPNPTFDGEAVKTQFAINIPAASAGSRLSGSTVQGQTPTPTFRGMSNIRLVPFIIANTTGNDAPLTGRTQVTENAILLADLTNSDLTGTASYKIYNDINLKIGTSAFLFYGEATPQTGDNVNGALVPSYTTGGWVGTTLDQIHFDLKQIHDASKEATRTTSEQDMLKILNAIANAEGWATQTEDTPLKDLYDSFVSLKAGSSNSILATVQALYNNLNGPQSGVTGEPATTVKNAINTAITTYFNASPDPAAPEATLTFKDDYAKYNDDGYPTNIGLPDGAVQLSYTEPVADPATDGAFTYVTDVDYDTDDANVMNVAALNDYVYPASLYYWTNTACRVSDNSEAADYEANKDDEWSQLLTDVYGNVGNGSVAASTRSVGLVNQINYAVARFDLNVKFVGGELLDNGKDWPTAGQGVANSITVPADGMKMTGVLVGGQKNVGWDFAQTTTQTKEQTIYDSYLGDNGKGLGVKANTPVTAYTLALQTKEKETNPEVANFALEFVNNTGEDFVGHDGIVPAGGKFYLVGQLTTNPTEGGNNKANDYIFEQDHTTVANVTISSLKSAYNCIPDLRTPGLELGLSVNLEWESGLVNDVTIE